MKLLVIAAAAMSMFTAKAYADVRFNSELDRQNYLTLDSVDVEEVALSKADSDRLAATIQRSNRSNDGFNSEDVGELGSSIIGIINDPANLQNWVTVGQKLWQVVLANRPVANVSTQKVSILPASQPNWLGMSNWQGPISKTYTMSATNLYGVKVIEHTYTLAYNYGGQLNGKGAFLANATMIPTKVEVLWGFTLNSRVEVGDAVNMGSVDSPTPGVGLEMFWSIDTILKHEEGRDTFFVRGDGQASHLN